MIYVGQAEILTIIALALLVFLIILILQRLPALRWRRPHPAPILDLVLAAIAGSALGAPLILPGLQVISGSRIPSRAEIQPS